MPEWREGSPRGENGPDKEQFAKALQNQYLADLSSAEKDWLKQLCLRDPALARELIAIDAEPDRVSRAELTYRFKQAFLQRETERMLPQLGLTESELVQVRSLMAHDPVLRNRLTNLCRLVDLNGQSDIPSFLSYLRGYLSEVSQRQGEGPADIKLMSLDALVLNLAPIFSSEPTLERIMTTYPDQVRELRDAVQGLPQKQVLKMLNGLRRHPDLANWKKGIGRIIRLAFPPKPKNKK